MSSPQANSNAETEAETETSVSREAPPLKIPNALVEINTRKHLKTSLAAAVSNPYFLLFTFYLNLNQVLKKIPEDIS